MRLNLSQVIGMGAALTTTILGCGGDAKVDDSTRNSTIEGAKVTDATSGPLLLLSVRPERRTREQSPGRYLPDWPFVNLPGTYRYAPVAIMEDNRVKLWTCGGPLPGSSNDVYFDRITYHSWGGNLPNENS